MPRRPRFEDPGYVFDPEPSPEQRASQIAFHARSLSADGALTAEVRAKLEAELEDVLRGVSPGDAATTRAIFGRSVVTSGS